MPPCRLLRSLHSLSCPLLPAGFPSPGSASAPPLPALAALQVAAVAAPKPLSPEHKQQVAREAMKEVRTFPTLQIRGAVAVCIEEVWEAMKEVRTFPAGARKPRGLLFSYQHRVGMSP